MHSGFMTQFLLRYVDFLGEFIGNIEFTLFSHAISRLLAAVRLDRCRFQHRVVDRLLSELQHLPRVARPASVSSAFSYRSTERQNTLH